MIILSVESVARDALRSLMLSLCNIIYRLISFVYEVFYNLGTARLLFDSDVQPIFRKVGLIIGLFMVFRVAFAFIQYVVNPDTMFDKQKGIGKIIVKVIVSIVLLGSTQYLFNAAFTIQNKILESQILEKVILGGEYTETESGMRDFGSNLSSTFFTSFYRINDDSNLANSETYNLCKNILGENNEELKENIRTSSGSITGTGANVCLNLKSEYNNDDSNIDEAISKNKIDKEEYIINFDGDGLVALLVGGLCLYTGFMFTFQVAVRLIQLAYLELIAPIPIIMYITPKGDEQLKKWGTQCTTTFLDFFLRVAIIYFAKFIVEIILNSNALNIYADSNGFESLYLTCIMIIATLIFVKKVPNLLKEIFPSLGGAAAFDYGLSFKKQVVEPLKWAYNTPLGWGLKLGKKAAVAGIGTIDRKMHGLPKPRNKLLQWFDKLTPGRAEYIKNRNQAIADRKERERKYELGRKYATDSQYSYTDSDGERKLNAEKAFKNKEYINSYNELKKAKKNRSIAQSELESAQREASAAYSLSRNKDESDKDYKARRDKAIAVAEAKVDKARKKFNSMDGIFEQVKAKHESIKKIYTKDAQIEDAFKYYQDINETQKPFDDENGSDGNTGGGQGGSQGGGQGGSQGGGQGGSQGGSQGGGQGGGQGGSQGGGQGGSNTKIKYPTSFADAMLIFGFSLSDKDKISSKDVRKRFIQLSKKHHPDLNPNDPNAEENFKSINRAYELLCEVYGR